MTIKETLDHIPESVKHIGDGTSATIGIGALINMLPEVSAILTIVWMALRIYETDTVQRFLPCKKGKV